jgi:hypothetical protein
VAVVLRRIREVLHASPGTPVLFTVVSPLAEGADRLVAREVLTDEQAELEVPLPLPHDEYERDFGSAESRREFDELLARAREVTVLGSGKDRAAAYERAGRYVVDRCDVLIAVWDGDTSGGQGGTAGVVAYARERGVPLMWIVARGRNEIVEEAATVIGWGSFRELERYDRAELPRARFEDEVRRQAATVRSVARDVALPPAPVERLSTWLWPFYVRADLLAARYQARYQALGTGLFLMAAGAVAAVAGQAIFAPEHPELVWIEVALMLGLLLIVGGGRRLRLHDQWISYRFLAERFRSAFFLAAAGLGGRREGGLERVHLGRGAEEWLRRAFAEVWAARPKVEMDASEVEGLRRFLAKAWIGDQVRYHHATSHKNALRHRRLTGAIAILFAITLLAAVLHSLGIGGHGSAGTPGWANALTFLAIALPALGAALGGIRAEREYLRQSERFGRMAQNLEDAERRMETAADLEAVRSVAAEAEELMQDEAGDWFAVVRFHDFELHV